MKALGLRAEWVEDLTAGQLRGTLAVAQKGMDSPQWKGQLELRGAELAVPELAVPVKIAAASVVWQEQRLVMPSLRASAGGLSWSGSYRYEVDAARPHRLVIDAETVEIADLEKVLGPLTKGTGVLSRALGIGADRPMSGAAEIEVKAKRIGILENVRATLWREGEKVTLSVVTGDWRTGKLRATGTVRLGADGDVSGKFTGLQYEGGVAETDFKLTGRTRLTIAGTAKLTGGPAETMTASYKWESPSKLTVTAAEAVVDGRKVPGKLVDSPLVLEFSDVLKLPLR
jgi:hypothetical protein